MEATNGEPDFDCGPGDRLPDILARVHDSGERFIVEREGATLAVIQPATAREGPSLHQLPDLFADVPWPDPDFFDELEVIHAEMNRPIESPQWLS